MWDYIKKIKSTLEITLVVGYFKISRHIPTIRVLAQIHVYHNSYLKVKLKSYLTFWWYSFHYRVETCANWGFVVSSFYGALWAVKSNAPSGHKWITTGAWDNFVFDVHMCVCFINKFANMYTYKLLSALKKIQLLFYKSFKMRTVYTHIMWFVLHIYIHLHLTVIWQ